MTIRNALSTVRNGTFALLLTMALLATAGPAHAGGMWFKTAAGISDMAMGDINDGTFRFYDTSPDGYNLPDVKPGFSLSFHLGNQISEKWAFGFSWDIQHAHVSGTDVDVTAELTAGTKTKTATATKETCLLISPMSHSLSLEPPTRFRVR